MYLLDTTHCLKLFKGALEEKLSILGEVILSISVITRGELIFGIHKSELVSENLTVMGRFIDTLDVYLVNEITADIYGELKNTIFAMFGPKDKSKRRNFRVQSLGFFDNDLWIAATAIQHGLILVSADSHLKRLQGINGLEVEVW